jgi:hypothetical protein
MNLQCTGAVHRESTQLEHCQCHHGVPGQETAIGGSVTLRSHFGNTVNVPVQDIARELMGNPG